MFTGRTPDITPAQIGALVTFVIGQAVAYGVLDVRYQQLAVSIGSAALGIAWKLADAYLRGKRATAHVPASPTTTHEQGGVTTAG